MPVTVLVFGIHCATLEQNIETEGLSLLAQLQLVDPNKQLPSGFLISQECQNLPTE